MKGILKHILIGISIPITLLVCAFLIPEPYSHPFIYLGLASSKVMPFLENRELMSYLTEMVFGRMTPNFAPIQIIFLSVFWFAFSVLMSVIMSYFSKANKNA